MTLAPTSQAALLQSKEGCIQVATAATENYRECMLMVVEAWVRNDYGPLSDLADAVGKSVRTLERYQTDLRKEGRLPSSRYARINPGQRRAAVRANVENDVIDAEVTVVPAEEEVTARSIKDRLKSKPKTYPTNSDVRRNQPERHDQQSDGGPDGDDSYWNIDAEHYQHVQDSDEPDSYKEAQYLLTQFSILLRKGSRDGWSEEAFNSIRTDLDGWARTCAACSFNYRERADERAEEEWNSIKGRVCGSESGSSTLGIESSELN